MKRSERGFTLVEIMIVVAIIALLAAIAIPNILRGRTSANEAAAIGNIRALVTSMEMYRSVNNRYPQDENWNNGATGMYPAGAPAFGPPSFGTAAIGATLVADTIQGFNYTYATVPAGCTDALGDCGQYTMLVNPQTIGNTGTRSFLADETALVRHCTTGAAAATVAELADESTIDAAPTVCD